MPKITIDTNAVAYVILDDKQTNKMEPQVTFVCTDVHGKKGRIVELSFDNMTKAKEAYEAIGDCGTVEIECYGISIPQEE